MIYLSGSSRPQRLLLCSGAHHLIIFWIAFTPPISFYGILHSKLFGSEKWQLNLTFRSVVESHWKAMGTFLCNECGKSFTEEAYLYIHQTDIWRHIWKCTGETSQINAANMSNCILLCKYFEDTYIWKRTVEKSPTNATNVTMDLLEQVIWGNIWKCTVEKSQKM